jgi:hypothetical protein
MVKKAIEPAPAEDYVIEHRDADDAARILKATGNLPILEGWLVVARRMIVKLSPQRRLHGFQ